MKKFLICISALLLVYFIMFADAQKQGKLTESYIVFVTLETMPSNSEGKLYMVKEKSILIRIKARTFPEAKLDEYFADQIKSIAIKNKKSMANGSLIGAA